VQAVEGWLRGHAGFGHGYIKIFASLKVVWGLLPFPGASDIRFHDWGRGAEGGGGGGGVEGYSMRCKVVSDGVTACSHELLLSPE
jgi:hypothetical protein